MTLHLAALDGHCELFSGLCNYPFTSEKDSHGFTPLILACIRKKSEVAQQLVEAGADLSSCYANSHSVLYLLVIDMEDETRAKWPDKRARKQRTVFRYLLDSHLLTLFTTYNQYKQFKQACNAMKPLCTFSQRRSYGTVC